MTGPERVVKGSWNCDRVKLPTSSCIAGLRWTGRHAAGQRNNVAASDAPYLVWRPGFGIWSRCRIRRHFENSHYMKFDPKKLRYSKEGGGRCVSLSTEQKPEGILRRQSSFAEATEDKGLWRTRGYGGQGGNRDYGQRQIL